MVESVDLLIQQVYGFGSLIDEEENEVQVLYADLLKQYIEKSGLSLSEISEGLKKHGHRVDKSYISKLQNGKAGPGSIGLNRALAKVTGGDAENLIEAAFYDKAPPSVRRVIDEKKRLIDSFDPDEYQAYLLEQDRMHQEMLAEIRERDERLYQEEWAKTNAEIQAKQEERLREITQQYKIEEEKDREDSIPTILDVPLLESIPAGTSIADAQVKGWSVVVNPMKLKNGELFMLRVEDDSMAGSRIFEDDLVLVQIQSEVEDGEIAVVNVNDENATLKRLKQINGQLILMSDNPKYDPIVVESEAVRICGRAVQVMFDPNNKRREE